MSAVQQLALSSGRDPEALPSQVLFSTPGTYSWTVPNGVYSVSVVCVGGGGTVRFNRGAGGGGLGYKNNIQTYPGQEITIVVGAGGDSANPGGDSYFNSLSIVSGKGGGGNTSQAIGGSFTGDGGGNGGGSAMGAASTAGAGAGGYSGDGGNAGSSSEFAANGSGGGGAGGDYSAAAGGRGDCGGGVGVNGQGTNGVATGGGGGGGSGGTAGGGWSSGAGGLYGGGGGGTTGSPRPAGRGAVRIIWPGNLRQFPSTRTADE